MTRLNDALANVTRLGMDTPPVIYFVEANPQYDALVTEIFQRGAHGRIRLCTSVITLTEVLVQPIRRGNARLEREYRDLLINSADFETFPINSVLAEDAAELRARYNLRTPDALQIAVALEAGCEAFLTNDNQLSRVTELQ